MMFMEFHQYLIHNHTMIFSSGCQFTLSFVLIVGEDVFYHPYLEDQEDYYVEMEFNSCGKKFYEDEVLKNFNQKDWEF